ncbi:MAG: tetratricopeptide repeat protein, partial [Phycisphaerae bacterium]
MIALTFATVGFGIVYVLGSRGFCLYGCPYGAVFGLVDRVAPGKIRVNDKCQQCGTCTAACSSGVRVHEEVARYGMVVSPTCLKDLDCVGVCPHGALSYGFGRPTLAKTVRSDRPVRKQYDFAWWEDGLMAVVLLAVLFIYRGLYDLLPFLMTLGLGAIAAYSCVALLRLTRGREVRVNRVVLRHDGRMRPVGWAFVAMMIVFGVVTVHSAAMQYHSRQGRRYYHLVQAGASAASASEAGAVAADASARAAAHLGVVDRWGLVAVDRHLGMLADLSVRAQRWQDADAYYTRLLSRNPGSAQVLAGYATALMGLKQPDRAVAALRAALDLQPESANTHYALAGALFDMRRFAEARHHLDEAVRIDPNLVHAHYDLGALLVEQGEFESGIEHLRVAVKLAPDFADAHYNLGVALAMTGRLAEAKRAIDHAGQLNPNDAQTVAFRAYLDQQSLGGATAIGRSP